MHLSASTNASMKLHLVRPTGAKYVVDGLLRMSDGGERPWVLPVGAVRAAFNGEWLVPTANTSRLYESPVPDSYNKSYVGFVVPSALVHNGVNTLVVACASADHLSSPSCDGLNVAHVELMLTTE